jgi:hypothetical protein
VLLTLLVSVSVSGCATTKSANAAKVLESELREVSPCEYIGDVYGTSNWGGKAAATGINNAKNKALEQAAEMGATHIVWTAIYGGPRDTGYTGSGPSSFVSGRAYRCD